MNSFWRTDNLQNYLQEWMTNLLQKAEIHLSMLRNVLVYLLITLEYNERKSSFNANI